MNWNTADTAPEGRIVATKIDDANGCRNESLLKRQGRMWFVPDGSMYVYYKPTHWRELSEAEEVSINLQAKRMIAAATDAARHMLESI
jgi:hypothetical protein